MDLPEEIQSRVEEKNLIAYENKETIMFLLRPWYEDYLGSDLLSDDPWFIEMQKKMGLE